MWNEFTNAVLEYVFTPGVRSAIEFDFYTNFIKYYQSNLDQIKLLKIIYVVIENLKGRSIITKINKLMISSSTWRTEATSQSNPRSYANLYKDASWLISIWRNVLGCWKQ